MSLGVIVLDSNGETLMVMKKFQSFISYVELDEAFALYEANFKVLEVGIHLLKAETDLLILWGLLMSASRYSNEIQLFVDSLCNLQCQGIIEGFYIVKCHYNVVAHKLAAHASRHPLIWLGNNLP